MKGTRKKTNHLRAHDRRKIDTGNVETNLVTLALGHIARVGTSAECVAFMAPYESRPAHSRGQREVGRSAIR